MNLDDANGRRAFALPGSTLHYGPDKIVDVEHIDLHLTPDLERHCLDAVCTTTVRALDEPVSMLSLNAVDLQIASVERDGKALRFTPRGDRLDVHSIRRLRRSSRRRSQSRIALPIRVTGSFSSSPHPSIRTKCDTRGRSAKTKTRAIGFPVLTTRTKSKRRRPRSPFRKDSLRSQTARWSSGATKAERRSSVTDKISRIRPIS